MCVCVCDCVCVHACVCVCVCDSVCVCMQCDESHLDNARESAYKISVVTLTHESVYMHTLSTHAYMHTRAQTYIHTNIRTSNISLHIS